MGKGHVVITGATSGIGEACAKRFTDLGYEVWSTYLRQPESGSAVSGRSVHIDLTSEETIHAAVETIAEGVGDEGLCALVNNAGADYPGPLEFLPLDLLRAQLEVNVVGQVALTQACLPLLRKATGRIIFIGSIDGKAVTPFQGAYGASKHAIEAVADVFRMELSPWGIHVSLVEPGDIATPLWRKTMDFADRMLSELPEEANALYGDLMRGARARADQMSKGARPASTVVRAVEHALTARRPRPRYLVGNDARLRLAMELLPTRLVDRMIMKFIAGGK